MLCFSVNNGLVEKTYRVHTLYASCSDLPNQKSEEENKLLFRMSWQRSNSQIRIFMAFVPSVDLLTIETRIPYL